MNTRYFTLKQWHLLLHSFIFSHYICQIFKNMNNSGTLKYWRSFLIQSNVILILKNLFQFSRICIFLYRTFCFRSKKKSSRDQPLSELYADEKFQLRKFSIILTGSYKNQEIKHKHYLQMENENNYSKFYDNVL